MRTRGGVGVRRSVSSALAMVMGALAVVLPSALASAGPASAAAPLQGIDVSNWQGPVDWGAVRRSGRLYAFAKATEGQTFVDKMFIKNRVEMAANGLVLRGLYHFARPERNSPAAEAAHYLRTVGPLGPGEVPVLDLEVAPGPGVGDWAAEWLALVAQGTGKTPIIYSYQSYLYSIPTARLTGYPLWIAFWGSNDGALPTTRPKTDRWNSWMFWQYTSNAVVPGVIGRVDDSVFAGSAADLAAFAGMPLPASAPPDPVGDLLRGLLSGLLGGPKP